MSDPQHRLILKKETHEPKSLPPIKSLPLRKRLAIEASIKPPVKVIPKEETTQEEEECPTTPSSSGASSDSTIPIIHSPPHVEHIVLKKETDNKPIKQPLKKAYHWTASKGKATAAIVKSSKTFNNGGLPGNPLLWNNGDAEKNAPWTSAEDTINSFKSAWLGEDDEEEEEKVIEHKPINIKKSTSQLKRGRPPAISKKSSEIIEVPKVRKNSGRSTMDGKLYCTCRQPYDATRFMIACDRCDDWFHGECIGINEKESEFVDLYFCIKCSKITGKKTSWKPKCSNPACHKAARIGSHLGHLSKYCSDSCGMQVARARLELVEIKRRNNSKGDVSIPIAQLALMKQRQLRVNSFADKQDKKRLTQVRLEKQHIRDQIELVNKKAQLLDQLKLTYPRNNNNESEESEQLLLDEPCGFDSRLIQSDILWKQKDHTDYTVCLLHQCQKHIQWQNLISLEFEQERKEQFKKLAALEREKDQIKSRMRSRRSEKDLIKDLINGTISV